MRHDLGAMYARHTEFHLRPWEVPTSESAQRSVERLIANVRLSWFCEAREAMRGKRAWKGDK